MSSAGSTTRRKAQSSNTVQAEPTVRSFMVMHLLALDVLTDTVRFGVPGDQRWGLVISRADWQVYGKPDSLKVWAEALP